MTTKVPVKIVVAAPERTSAAIRFISGLARRSSVMCHCRIARTAVIQRSMTKRISRSTYRRRTPGASHSRSEAGTRGHCTSDRAARRSGCAASIPGRRLFVALHLLHASAAPVRACGIRSNRGRACGTAIPGRDGIPRRRIAEYHDHRPARAASERRQPSDSARKCQVQEQARRGTHGRRAPSTASGTVDCAEIARVRETGRRRARGQRDDRASVYSSNDLEPRGDRQAAPVIAAPLPLRPPVITPLAPTRYRIQVTVSAEAHDHLRRAQDLLRHTIPMAIRR